MFTIAGFRLSHLRRVLAIERACFAEEPYSEDLFRDYHARCPELFVVGKRRGRSAGYMITCIDQHRAEVISIAVHPLCQRKGLARRLIEHTLDRLSRDDVTEVGLMVRDTSEPGLRLYEHFGFRELSKAEQYYSDGGNAIRMIRRLAGGEHSEQAS